MSEDGLIPANGYLSELGVKMQSLRFGRGWSACEVADRCSHLLTRTVDEDWVYRMERGRASVCPWELKVLAKVFEVPYEEIRSLAGY